MMSYIHSKAAVTIVAFWLIWSPILKK